MSEIAQRMSEVLGRPQVLVIVRDGVVIGPIDGSDVMTNRDLLHALGRAELAGDEALLATLNQRLKARTEPPAYILGWG